MKKLSYITVLVILLIPNNAYTSRIINSSISEKDKVLQGEELDIQTVQTKEPENDEIKEDKEKINRKK